MPNVENQNGEKINFETAIELMDDDLREMLHTELAPCSNQEFFSAYEIAHRKKFCEQWELSKSNPVW